MLVKRLVVDALRRCWVVYAAVFGMTLGLSWLGAKAASETAVFSNMQDVLPWGLIGAWFAGIPLMVFLEFRELTMLPVSRREAWRARWWLAVCLAPLAASGGLVAAHAMFSAPATVETLILSFVYGVLYAGCGLVMQIAMPLSAQRLHGWKLTVALIFQLSIWLAGAAAPMGFAAHLPHTFGGLAGPMVNVLIAAAGITGSAYFYRPPNAARASRPNFARSQDLSSITRTGLIDRLTGVEVIAFRAVRQHAAFFALTLLIAVAYWRMDPAHLGLAEFFRASTALIFEGAGPGTSAVIPIFMLLVVSPIAPDTDLIGDIRRLRALPLSATTLALTLSGAGVLFASAQWIFLLILHAIVAGTAPHTLRPELFLSVAGVFALVQSVRLALRSGGLIVAIGAGILIALGAVRFMVGADTTTVRLLLGLAGATALALSFLINRWSIRNRSGVYKFRGGPTLFGRSADPNQNRV